MICKLCDFNSKSSRSLAYHLSHSHNIDSKTYYDTYLKKPNEDICPVCNKQNIFNGLHNGYSLYCSKSCASIMNRRTYNFWEHVNESTIKKRNDKIRQTKNSIRQYIVNDLNGILVQTLIKLYGQTWYTHRIVPIKKYKDVAYIDKKYVKNIIRYNNKSQLFRSSYEYEIYAFIKSFYKNDIQHNCKLFNKEVDIYLPDYSLIIEYNGKHWHDYRDVNSDINRKLYFEDYNQNVYFIKDCHNNYDDFLIQLNRLKEYILKEGKKYVHR